MIAHLLDSESWQPSRQWQADEGANVDAAVRHVLMVTSALTRFLAQKYALRLDVHLHDQCMSMPTRAEAALLDIAPDTRCLRRKVSLKARGEVMFDAESMLPLDTLPVALMQALEEGRRPLADVLSDQGLMLSRSNLSIARVQTQGLYEGCWARRSVLCAESGAKALVTEVFFDAFWRKLHYKAAHPLGKV